MVRVRVGFRVRVRVRASTPVGGVEREVPPMVVQCLEW
jgi:hypothetical protein